MKSFLFLLASARVGGNSELLAREAAKHLPRDVDQKWLRLNEYPLEAFEDVRHESEGTYGMPAGNAQLLIEATLAADTIVFAAPVYWYSLPAPAKLYLDHWSHWMRVPELDFKNQMRGKTLFLTSAMAGENASEAEPLIKSLKLTAGYLGMNWGGHVLAHANAAGDVFQQKSTLQTASTLLA